MIMKARRRIVLNCRRRGDESLIFPTVRSRGTQTGISDSSDAAEIKLVFGATAANDKELAVLTRSILHLMQTMASQVEVSPEDLAQTRAVPGWESAQDKPGATRMVQIQSSKRKPTDTFVAIDYRDHWFWIDDRDLKTKRAFAFMMMLFTLADTSDKENLPLITIPAQ